MHISYKREVFLSGKRLYCLPKGIFSWSDMGTIEKEALLSYLKRVGELSQF